MATHNPDYLMTAAEAKKHYRYMQPHSVRCGGECVKETEYDAYTVDYFEVCSGVVTYHVHATTADEAGRMEAEKAAYEAKQTAETEEENEEEPETMKDENREHCKRIAAELEAYADGSVYRCPECGSICTIEEGEDADGFTVYLTSCGCTLEYEPEQLSVYDFIADAYDIEYRAGSDKEYRSAKIMVACGGPNIYIDTASRSVKLYWWTDHAEYPISSDVCDELDNIMEELWRC